MNRNRHGMLAMLLCAALALLLAGCGGDDGVSPTTHGDLQSEYDTLKVQYDTAVAQIGAMTDAASNAADASLWARINYYMEMIGSPNDMADAMGSLNAQLNHYMAMIGSMQDMPDPDGSLNAQINSYKAMIGDPADMADAMGSLNAQINHYMGMIGSMDDAADMSGSLYAQLNHYKDMVGSSSDAADENGSLNAQINHYKARIAELEAGTAPSEIAKVAKRAMDAYDAAKTAYEAADEAAGKAEMADDNRATIQVGATNADGDPADSVMAAKNARIHAKTAMTEAGDAKTAADAAANAANTGAATAQELLAKNAQGNAEEAKGDAEDARDRALADAMVELKIDGTMKSVGDLEIDAATTATETTRGTGTNARPRITGLLGADKQPTNSGTQTTGKTPVAGNPALTPNPYVAPMVNAQARSATIGKTLDDPTDMVRLMLVTKYAGVKTVKVYAIADSPTPVTAIVGTPGAISLDDTTTTADTNDRVTSTLRSMGMYYQATGGTAGDLEPLDPANDGSLNGDTVLADDPATGTTNEAAMPVEVFAYSSAPGADNQWFTPDDIMTYVVHGTTTTTGGVTTVTYNPVDIHVEIDRDGDATTTDVGAATGNELVEVTARITDAIDYSHIHFGVWAGLGEPKTDGSQSPSGLGIGFVQNIVSGGSMTADMPNNGTASYSGDWVATVQSAHPDGTGDVALEFGKASLMADFRKDTIEATLTGLAKLSGDISDNTFSGDKVSDISDNRLSSDADDFTGSFNGGFYGEDAVEAGGVFDFMSDGMEDGGFRGAFGGGRNDD